MARVRLFEAADREALAGLRAEAFGLSREEALGEKGPPGARVWLVWPSGGEEGPPAGFCRMVPDQETRAMGRACLDGLYVRRAHRRQGLGRVLLGAALEATRAEGLEGFWAYLPVFLTEDFLRATGGRKVHTLRLLRHEHLDRIPAPRLPAGYGLRTASLPDDLDPLAALYNEIFAKMWNFRPHGPQDMAAWFASPDTKPENFLILEFVGEGGGPARGAGMAVIAVDPARIASGDNAAYIPDIGVAPAHRRRGLGRVLLGTAAERARAQGLAALELIVDEDDAKAQAFYKSLEFEPRGAIGVYEWRAGSVQGAGRPDR